MHKYWGINAHHDTETQAQRAREKDVAVLDAEVGLAWEEAHKDVDAYDGRAKDASFTKNISTSQSPDGSVTEASRTNAAHYAQNPPAGIIVDTPRRQRHGDSLLSIGSATAAQSSSALRALSVGYGQVCRVSMDADSGMPCSISRI